MVSVRYLCTSLERFGLINFHRFARHDWKNSLQSVYVFCQSTLFLFHILCHLFSTLTRATRYLPEFFQTFLEDCVIFFLAYAVYFLRSRHHQITYLSDFMETAFSKADPRIIQKCYRQGKLTCLGFLIVVALAIAGSFLETFLPMSSSELRIRRSVYSETKHPERRLPFNLRVPFVDETESWAYEIIYAIDIYIMINFIFWVSLSVSVVPIMILHIRGQYEILSKYVALIGKEHRDGHGYRIFYNNIEADDYMVKMYSGVGRRRRGRFRDVCLALRRQITYERHYLRQIIEFHQKLLNFQDEVGILIHSNGVHILYSTIGIVDSWIVQGSPTFYGSQATQVTNKTLGKLQFSFGTKNVRRNDINFWFP